METNPYLLWQLLLRSFLGGILLGAIYDTMRLSRVLFGVCHYADIALKWNFPLPFANRLPNKKASPVLVMIFLSVQDILFCFSAGILIAILLFDGNNGGFRGFVLLGLLAGFLLYYVTLGKLLIRISEYIIFAVKLAVLYAVFYITKPILFLAKRIANAYKEMAGRFLMYRLRRYDIAKREQLLKLSDMGFVGLQWKENGKNQIYTSK